MPDTERTTAYYRGVADAMDVLRAYDFPMTERVDHIADVLAPPHVVRERIERLTNGAKDGE